MEQYGSRLDIIKEYGYCFRMRQIKERKMKKLLALVLVIMMLFMTACGKKEDPEQSEPVPSASSVVSYEPVTDTSSDVSESSEVPESSDILESPEIQQSSVIEEEKLPLNVVSFEYSIRYEMSDFYLFYVAKVENPNVLYSVMMPEFSLKVKDKTAKEEEISSGPLCDIAASDTQVFCGACIITTEEIDEVEYTLKPLKETSYALQNDSGVPYAEDLSVSNVEKTGDIKYSAEVTNLSPVKLTSLKASVIYRKDGKLVLVDTKSVDEVAPGETISFTVSSWFSGFDYDDIEVLVTPI